MNKTTISIPSIGQSFEVQGALLAAAAVRTMYATELPGIANMQDSTADSQNANGGTTRVITFSPRTGNKG